MSSFLYRMSESSDQMIDPPVNWSHVTALIQPVESCLKLLLGKWLQTPDIGEPSVHAVSACMNFMATYYSKYRNQVSAMMH